MTWNEARAVAGEVMKSLSSRFQPEEIRLVLRALSRLHHKGKTMNTPSIIISEVGPDHYQIDVCGRFGVGFRNLRTDRNGVLQRLGYLKSFDCGTEPAAVVVPADLEAEFRKVFPSSFD